MYIYLASVAVSGLIAGVALVKFWASRSNQRLS